MFRHLGRSSLPYLSAATRRRFTLRVKSWNIASVPFNEANVSQGIPTVERNGITAALGSQHCLWRQCANYTNTSEEAATKKEAEVIVGKEEVHEFKTETKKLLRCYSELVSNAADALEKLKHIQAVENIVTEKPLEIRISVDREKKQFILQDSGIGMTLEELNENLGTIASSGSKKFLEKLEKGNSGSRENIIGQFGVGFYSTVSIDREEQFMVGDKIKVYTRSARPGSKGYCWTTDGQGSYSVAEAENVAVGTKIVIDLREDCKAYGSSIEIDSIIKKYSNFIGFPIYLNDKEVNTVDALWTKDKNSVTPEQHTQFYRFIANAWDDPQYTLHFKTEAPVSISSVLYVPERHMETFGERMQPGVSLYSRKVLIQPKSSGLLPEWLRFVRGVVDSEDIPLNVSRELLQDNILSRLRKVVTSRVLKWLQAEAKKDAKKYNEFFFDFGQFIKEGICTDAMHKCDIAKLLRFESSETHEGELVSLQEYVDRKKEDQKRIYYLLTPKRQYAESSPYAEMFQKKSIELLYLYDSIDEFVVSHLKEFEGVEMVAADSAEAASDPLLQYERDESTTNLLSDNEAKELAQWVQNTLGKSTVKQVDISRRLDKFPAMGRETGLRPAMRRMLQMMPGASKMEQVPAEPTRLEINPDHAVMRGLFQIRNQDPTLAKIVTEQIYDNALCAAGVLDDPRSMITRLNMLLEISVKKSVEQDKKVTSA
ncbi:TNF receptor-associated protein 1, mitochondrial [Apophysomyces ossiformis]|uniref:TNF receptor-associated protein 1, mitochondrial n=1 Tax=Apophysomyces ossiformis TaxID=679940 RepID=A0A8H7BDT0_9FUNG|nr:TNF receptor-associated protein 1, mitochondrial [Apophysomyces ossiformis]